MSDMKEDVLSRLQFLLTTLHGEVGGAIDDTLECEGNCDAIDDILERAIDLAILFKHEINDIAYDWYCLEEEDDVE